ncbi:hypothetical protein LTR94_027441, partial [Friedmanniomyces endolithicus]
MIREFPFIEGAVSGFHGKLMFDTGARDAITVNSHNVLPEVGTTVGTGFFGSGQTFDIQILPEIADVKIGGLDFPSATNVMSQDARQLERITPDFIGWVGYQFFADHAFKLDYQNAKVTFFAAGAEGYLDQERIAADLAFTTRRLPNHPIMSGSVGDLAIIAAWDTGQQG